MMEGRYDSRLNLYCSGVRMKDQSGAVRSSLTRSARLKNDRDERVNERELADQKATSVSGIRHGKTKLLNKGKAISQD